MITDIYDNSDIRFFKINLAPYSIVKKTEFSFVTERYGLILQTFPSSVGLPL